jgi:hypothetical protein
MPIHWKAAQRLSLAQAAWQASAVGVISTGRVTVVDAFP